MWRNGHREGKARRIQPKTRERRAATANGEAARDGPDQWRNSVLQLRAQLPARVAAAALSILSRTHGIHFPDGAVVRARRGGKRFEIAATATKSWDGAAERE